VRGRSEHEQAAGGTRGGTTVYRCAPMRTRKFALAALLLMTIGAGTAQASPEQASIMMDDDQLVYRSDATRARALVAMKSLGVEVVRVTVLWKTVAEGASLTNTEIARLKGEALRSRARRQRARFKPRNPRTYPTRNWDRYDNLVKEAAELGLRVYFTITGPGPSYAHRKAPPSQRRNAGTYKPYPTRFRDFVEAVGRRYNGRTRDENGVKRTLPRVARWSIWNEPNQPGWLTPQYERRDGQVVPASPAIYRKLYQAGALEALHAGLVELAVDRRGGRHDQRATRGSVRLTPFSSRVRPL